MTTATRSTKRTTVIEPAQKVRRKPRVVIRPAYIEDVGQIHGLIDSHRREGHLLPRELDELTRHARRFLVAVRGKRVIACGELAPLSQSLAEIRSLVVDRNYRGFGVGRLLAEELRQRARRDLFDRLCAFTHQPAYFARLGFSIVPHVWLPEKIGTDCASCVLFRRCGQIAMLDDLEPFKEYRVQGVVAHA
jgi:amino-acid N-acetyltransferase